MKFSICLILIITSCLVSLGAQDFDYVPKSGVFGQKIKLEAKWKSEQGIEFSYDGKIWQLAPTSLSLSALLGEERTYTIYLREKGKPSLVKQANYTIDRQGPVSELPNFIPGTYEKPITLVWKTSKDIAKTIIQVNDGQSVQSFTNASLLSGSSGKNQIYTVSVRSFDASGNGGPTSTYDFNIDRSNESLVNQITVISPIPGVFSNRQLIFIKDEGLSDIQYTISGKTFNYDKPELLPAGNNQEIIIRAKNTEGKDLVKKLSFTSLDENLSVPNQGLIYRSSEIAPLSGFTITKNGQIPQVSSSPFNSALPLVVEADLNTFIEVRLLRLKDAAQFRFTYIFEGIRPQSPVVYSRLLGPKLTNDKLEFEHEFIVGSTEGLETLAQENSSLSISKGVVRIDAARKLQSSYFSRNLGGVKSENSTLILKSPSIANIDAPISKYDSSQDIVNSWLPEGFKGWVYFKNAPWSSSGWFYTEDSILEIPPQIKTRISYACIAADDSDAFGFINASMDIDSSLPEAPVITQKDNKLSLSGNGEIQYRITDILNPNESATFKPYQSEIVLNEEIGVNHVYVVETYLQSANGKKSAILKSQAIPLFTINPDSPKFKFFSQAQINLGDEDLKLELINPISGLQYRYIIIDEQGKKSQALEFQNLIELKGVLGKKINYKISIVSQSIKNKNLISDPTEFQISHNRKVPDLPVLSGIVDGKEYNTSISIKLDPKAGPEYVLSKVGEDKQFMKWKDDLELSLVPNQKIAYEFQYRLTDQEGNTALSKVFHFVMDGEIPDLPQFHILELNTKSNLDLPVSKKYLMYNKNDIEISLTSNEKMSWKVIQDGKTIFDSVYSGPISFQNSTENSTISIEAYAFDPAGNKSELSELEYHLLKAKPSLTEKPQVIRNQNKVKILWPKIDGLFYKISPNTDFQYVNDFLDFELKPESPLQVFYKLVDKAGNESDEEKIDLIWKPVAKKPNLQNKISYLTLTNDLSFTTESENQEIVFSLDGGQNYQSAQNKIVHLDFEKGIERDFNLRVKTIGADYESSDILSLDFLIDTKVPLPPKSSLKDIYSRLDRKTSVSFEPEGVNEQVYFSVQEFHFELDSGSFDYRLNNEESEMLPFKKAFQIDPNDNEITIYYLKASSHDAAGNQSEIKEYWIFSAPHVAFVREGGIGDGSIWFPSGSVPAAIQSGMNKLYLGAGTFSVDNQKLAGNYTIRGGFDFQSYSFKEDLKEPTVLFPRNSSSEYIFNISSGKLALKSIYLLDGGSNIDSLIKVQGAELEFNQILMVGGKGTTGISLSNSIGQIVNSRISTQSNLSNGLINLNKSKILIDTSVIEGIDLPPVLQKKSVLGNTILINASESTIQIQNSSLTPRYAQNTIAVKSYKGSLFIKNSKVSAGLGLETTLAIDATETETKIIDSELFTRFEVDYGILIKATKLNLELTNIVFNLDSKKGSIGLSAYSSSAIISGLKVNGSPKSEFLYGFSANDSHLSLSKVEIINANSSDTLFGKAIGSIITIVNSSFETRGKVGSAISILEGTSLSISDSSFETSSGSSLIVAVPTIKMIELKNVQLSGWLYAVGESTGNGSENRPIDESKYPYYGAQGINIVNLQTQVGL